MKLNWKTLAVLLFAVAVIIVSISDAVRLTAADRPLKLPPEARLRQVYPEAAAFALDDNGKWPCIAALDADRQEIGAVFFSERLPPSVRGYAGTISLLAAIDRNGEIKGSLVLKHSETPAYFAMLGKAAYLDSFKGKNVADDFSKLDAVSGATITSDAIKNDLIGAARLLAQERYGIKSPDDNRLSQKDYVALALVATLLVLATVAHLRHSRRIRQATLLASLLLLGLGLNYSLNIQQISSLLALSIPVASPALLLLFAFAIIAALLRRQTYCRMLCPYGAMQEFIYKLLPYRLAPSPHMVRLASRLKYLVLFGIIVLFFAFGIKAALMTEPFGAVFEFSASKSAMAFALAVLLASAFYKRFFCRCLCPSGACMQCAGEIIPALRRMVTRKNRQSLSVPPQQTAAFGGWRDMVFVMLLAAALCGFVGVALSQHYELQRQEGVSTAAQRKYEKVDIERIRHGVYNGNLSDSRARHWKTADENE